MRQYIAALAAIILLSGQAMANSSEAIVNASGVKGGLVVKIGCGNADELADLKVNDGFLVHVLDTDAATVAAARAALEAKGLYGKISVDTFDGTALPYVDNLVNLVIADGGGKVPREEILRVLTPRGVAVINGKTTVKAVPPDIDEWTHYLHGPGNNAVAADTVVGPPLHLQWAGPPRWTRDHGTLNSVSSVVTVGGRLFFILDDATGRRMDAPGEWALIARDAFNGVELWRRPMSSWTEHRNRFRSGPPQLPRLLVASEEHVYAPLGLSEPVSQMDAQSGKVLKTFLATKGAEEILLTETTLLVLRSDPVATHAVRDSRLAALYSQPRKKTIVAIDTASGRALWKTDLAGQIRAETLAAEGGSVFIQVDDRVVCYDKSSGKQRWVYGAGNNSAAKKSATPGSKKKGKRSTGGVGFGKHVLVVSDGVVLCSLPGGLTAISAKAGKKLWSAPGGQGFHAPLDVFVINGVVWTGNHPSDSTAPPPVHDFSVARDLHTGEVKSTNRVMVDLQTAGHHHRCYRNKATLNYIMSGKRGIEMFNVTGDNHSRNNWIRGTCQYGIMPANGLIYAPPNSCGCYPESLVRGFYAMASRRSQVPRQPVERLQKGPAYGRTQRQASTKDQPSSSWATFRADAQRTGVVATTLPGKLAKGWTAPVGGRLSQPVVAAGTLIVSSIDRHTVHAFDAATGKPLWSRMVGGRVDSPPTIHEGRVCLFGSADGYVYCLRLSDGELVWRFQAAPADRRTVVWGQVESVWPVHGSVLVMNGVAYVSAGRSTWFDHGIYLYGLDPETGKVLHRRHFESLPPEFGEGKDQLEQLQAKADALREAILKKTSRGSSRADYKTFAQSDRSMSFSMAGGTITDVLVSDGKDVYLHQVRFNARLEKQDKLARHLLSTSGFLHDPIEESRTHWVLGDGDFSQYPLPYTKYVGAGEKNPACGLILAYDSETAWSVLREKRYSKAAVCNLVAVRLTTGGEAQGWKVSLGQFVPKSILKSGRHLVVCGMIGDKSVVQFRSADGGKEISAIELEASPVWDGVAAAEGRLYVSLTDGRVVCYR